MDVLQYGSIDSNYLIRINLFRQHHELHVCNRNTRRKKNMSETSMGVMKTDMKSIRQTDR